ncbi:dynein heavy chain axonemal [Chrysochromulina tobinii]|uniref:Dynein heavy chain axonemal n=1 Tax=Chrysochromulina tobinii TaxID=1460289 RepID=A0A0M0K2K9_9EUKA|nr:dynein heavy chain axonemal [Chrysochromulina tobinii]|eukprot:KOO33040.1 dynein heavy chain axonemal [Chrysochromulina sp. CCMP291]
MYMTTRMINPDFSPELRAQVALINFTVTMAGLEQQLLSRVVMAERPELEEQRLRLVIFSTTRRLIEVLGTMKKTTRELKEKPSNASTAGERISIAFAEYRPVATRGALLYFLIVDMAAINVMYHLSLQQFLGLFDFSLAHSAPAPVAAKRIIMIIDFADFHVTSYVQQMLLLDKLLLLRALREDRTPLGVKEYVMDALGKRYADLRGARHSPPV